MASHKKTWRLCLSSEESFPQNQPLAGALAVDNQIQNVCRFFSSTKRAQQVADCIWGNAPELTIGCNESVVEMASQHNGFDTL